MPCAPAVTLVSLRATVRPCDHVIRLDCNQADFQRMITHTGCARPGENRARRIQYSHRTSHSRAPRFGAAHGRVAKRAQAAHARLIVVSSPLPAQTRSTWRRRSEHGS
eukprot:6933717-Prymnesium_polylepis.2